MSKVFNIYENIDMIDPAELKRAAGLKDPEKVTWPKGKKYKVQLGGKECSVTTYFSNAEGSAYGQFDAFTALSTMMTRDEVVEKMWELDPNGAVMQSIMHRPSSCRDFLNYLTRKKSIGKRLLQPF